jgi:hypothetical protein
MRETCRPSPRQRSFPPSVTLPASPKERTDLQKAEIKDKNDPDFSINLADKKLFFTSAKVAYAAKSKQNSIACGVFMAI